MGRQVLIRFGGKGVEDPKDEAEFRALAMTAHFDGRFFCGEVGEVPGWEESRALEVVVARICRIFPTMSRAERVRLRYNIA